MRERTLSITSALALLAIVPSLEPAHAQQQAALDYRAPASCPSRADFEAMLRARSHGRTMAAGQLRVELEGTGPVRGVVVLSQDGELVGARSLSAPDCGAAADALAFVAALLHEDRARASQLEDARAQPPRSKTRRQPRREAGATGGARSGANAATARNAPDRDAGAHQDAPHVEARGPSAREQTSEDPRQDGTDGADPHQDAVGSARARQHAPDGARTDASAPTQAGTVGDGAGANLAPETVPGARPSPPSPPVDLTPPEARLVPWLTLGPLLATGIAAHPRPGLELAAGLSRVRTRLELALALGVRATLPERVRSAEGDGYFRWRAAALDLCAAAVWRVRPALCLSAEAGRLAARGEATELPRRVHAAWFALGPSLRIRAQVWGPLALEPVFAVLAPLTRDRFVIGASELQRVPAVSFRALLRLLYEIR